MKIEKALREVDGAGDGVSIIDGLATALRLLNQRKLERRRVILLISEKHDESSEESLDKLIELTERVNATIYSVTFSPTRSMFANRPPKTAIAGAAIARVAAKIAATTAIARTKDRAIEHVNSGRDELVRAFRRIKTSRNRISPMFRPNRPVAPRRNSYARARLKTPSRESAPISIDST